MNDEIELQVVRATCILRRAKTPCILLGPGARLAIGAISKIAHVLGAPVLTTPDAKSLWNENDHHAGGVFSFGATDRARAIADASDAVLAVGTDLGEFASRSGRAFEHAAVVHVADDPRDFCIACAAAESFLGDIALTLRLLARAVADDAPACCWFDRYEPTPAASDERSRETDRGIDPARAILALADALPPEGRVTCDITSAALQVLYHWKFGAKQRLLLQIERSACMGAAVGTGLGVRLASGLATLVVIGDWGFMTGSPELHTVVSTGVGRFVIVVWSNSGGALIRAGVRAQGIDVPPETHSWSPPRFALVARGYGMRGLTVRSAEGLRRASAVALRAPYPVLIDAVIDPDAKIPGARERYVHLENSTRPTS